MSDFKESPMKGAGRWGWVPAWWLHHPEMTPERLGLLAALSTYADDEGWCDPSQSRLAQWLNRSRRWVNGAIADLATLEPGVLEKSSRKRPNGGTTSCLYRLRRILPEEGSLITDNCRMSRGGGESHGNAAASAGHQTVSSQENYSPARPCSTDSRVGSRIEVSREADSQGSKRVRVEDGFGGLGENDAPRGMRSVFSPPGSTVLTNQPQAKQNQESPPPAPARADHCDLIEIGFGGKGSSLKSERVRLGAGERDKAAASDEENWESGRKAGGIDARDAEAMRCLPVLLPADWTPSPAMLEKAAALYPDEDLTEHAALFVARCRGKGYQVRVEQADDFWLSWLIEDARKARRRGGKGRAERSMARSGKIEAGNHFTDFLAGAAGAGAHGGMLKGTRSDRDRTAAYNRFEAWGIAAS